MGDITFGCSKFIIMLGYFPCSFSRGRALDVDDWYMKGFEDDRDARLREAKSVQAEVIEYLEDASYEDGDEEEIEAQLEGIYKERSELDKKLQSVQRSISAGAKSVAKARVMKYGALAAVACLFAFAAFMWVLGSRYTRGWNVLVGNLSLFGGIGILILLGVKGFGPLNRDQELRKELKDLLRQHDWTTASIIRHKEIYREIGGGRYVASSSTERALRRIAKDPHVPPDMKMEAKRRLSADEEQSKYRRYPP